MGKKRIIKPSYKQSYCSIRLGTSLVDCGNETLYYVQYVRGKDGPFCKSCFYDFVDRNYNGNDYLVKIGQYFLGFDTTLNPGHQKMGKK